MTKKKQRIKCDVSSCVHQNDEEKECELDEIKVSSGNDVNDDEVIENEETICDSFDCDKEVVEDIEDDAEEIDEDEEIDDDELEEEEDLEEDEDKEEE